MEWYPSITKTFLRPPLFQHRALARCWFRREKARVVITGLHARWLVVIINNGFPVDWSDSGSGHLDLKFYNKTPFLLWIVKNNGFEIIKYLWFVNFKYLFKKKIIKFRKNSSFNWFIPFHVLIRPDVIWKYLSRPLYHVHFTVIHTNSRHKSFIHRNKPTQVHLWSMLLMLWHQHLSDNLQKQYWWITGLDNVFYGSSTTSIMMSIVKVTTPICHVLTM